MDICAKGSGCCTCQEGLPWHAENPNAGKPFGELLLAHLVHFVYMLFFRIDASLKKLFGSCHYPILFICLAMVAFKVNTGNLQYFLIFLDIHMTQNLLCTPELTTTFFHEYSCQRNMVYFSDLLAVKHVNLILWLEEYVALNYLHNLKILLCESKISFKRDSLRCVKYITRKAKQYHLSHFLVGDNVQFPILKSRIKKEECLEGVQEVLPQIFLLGGLLHFLSKRLCKIKYVFKGPTSNVDLGLFQQTNN